MSCIVEARIHRDRPRLALLDADTGALRMAWEPAENPPSEDVQRLFHQLFLALCGDDLRQPRP